MVLNITTTPSNGIAGDNFDYEIEPAMLKMNGTHVFINSTMWDEIHITLTEDIPLGTLKHLPKATKKLCVTVSDSKSKHIMMLCTELYPDKAGTIRKAFMLKGEIDNELLC